MLGEVIGGGRYADLLAHTQNVTGFGVQFRLVNLDKLVILKRAAGCPKDLPIIAALQKILERQTPTRNR